MVRPGTRNAVWRARASRFSQEKPSVDGKIWKSAQKRTRVPVWDFFTLPTVLRVEPSTKGVKGELGVRCFESSNSPGSPRRKHISWVLPPRSTCTSRRADRAFTTEAPTPWRPPEAA